MLPIQGGKWNASEMILYGIWLYIRWQIKSVCCLEYIGLSIHRGEIAHIRVIKPDNGVWLDRCQTNIRMMSCWSNFSRIQIKKYSRKLLELIMACHRTGNNTLVTYDNIGSDNCLQPVRRKAINWTNVDLISIGLSTINFNEIVIKIRKFSFKKLHFIMSAKRRPFRLGLNVKRGHFSIVTWHVAIDAFSYPWMCLMVWQVFTHTHSCQW